jgi:transposase
MEHTTIAVDLAKSVFQVAVSHRPGRLDEERRLARDRFLAFFAQRPPATIVLEACGSAHYWARQLQPLGHAVRLLPAHDVRPYVRRNKTDRTDAKGLLEANRNKEIHPVPVKSIEHQAIASLHRLRSTWLATRTARLNTLRGLLREFGIFIPVGSQRVVPRVRALLSEETVGADRVAHDARCGV